MNVKFDEGLSFDDDGRATCTNCNCGTFLVEYDDEAGTPTFLFTCAGCDVVYTAKVEPIVREPF